MIYLNQFKQLSDNAVASLYNLIKDLVNKNTTNILEVGTYAGQVTVHLCAAAGEKSSSVSVISIDDNNDTFSPSAEESLKENHFRNYSIESGELEQQFKENVIKANIIYIDRFHKQIEEKLEIIKKNIIIPTKVIFRNPKNADDYPFDVTEFTPEVKPRARKKIVPVKEEIKEEVKEEVKKEVKEITQNKKTTP